MNRLLADLRIVELSAFVAAPLGGMTMAQFGAEVIRIDRMSSAILPRQESQRCSRREVWRMCRISTISRTR